MKVLVTGANGFLGRSVVKQLRSAGNDTIGTARQEAAGLVRVDLGQPDAVWALMKSSRPTAIVNCAAVVDFGPGALGRQWPVNTMAPGLLAQWCAQEGAHLIHASTIAVHGRTITQIDDTTPVNSDTDYARSKLLAEDLIRASNCRSTIIRFPGLFGRNGPTHLGINNAIRCAHENQIPTIIGRGSGRRNYLFVEDAAAIIEHCISQDLTGLFWAGGSQSLSIREMMGSICDVLLPGRTPNHVDGYEARDQLVCHSPELPIGRGFREALAAEA